MINLNNTFYNNYSRSSVVKRQVFYSFIIKGISLLITIVYIPLLIDILDKERFGIWITLVAIFNWFSFFDIGLGNGLRNKLTEALSIKDYKIAKKYIATAYFIIGSIFFTLLIIFLIINRFVNWEDILNSTVIKRDELYVLTTIVLSFFLLRFIVQLIGVILIADQKTALSNGVTTLGNLISFIVIFTAYKLEYHLSLVLLGTLISGVPILIFIIITFIAYKGKYKYLKPTFKDVDLTLRKELLKLGFSFFIMQITAIILFQTAYFVIIQLYGPEEVATFSITFQYFQIPIMIFGIILSPIWSAVTEAYILKDFFWLKNTLKRLNQLSIIFVLGIIIMILISDYAFKLWIGDRFLIPKGTVIAMGIYAILNILLGPFSIFINGLGKLKLTTITSVISIIIYLLLIYYLNIFFNSSLSVIISMSLISLIGLFFQSSQTKKILNNKATGIWGC